MINIVLVDDHLVVRSGFSQLLSLEPDMRIVGEFGSTKETRQNLPRLKPDVCIMDISMPDEGGLELLPDIPQGIHCIMLSGNDSEFMVKKPLN